MIEDNWTRWARRNIAAYRLELWAEHPDALRADFVRGQIEWLEDEIVALRERKAADPSNVIVMEYYRDQCAPCTRMANPAHVIELDHYRRENPAS